MSGDDLGRHHFLAWARQGIGSTLGNPDYGGSLPVRGALQVGLDVAAHDPDSTASISPVVVQTFGPGDVLGIDPRHVVRTEPQDSTTNFEPNYLAGIEFDAPDLPWLFTPAVAAGDRLRPWVVLVVLSGSEFEPVPGVIQPLPAIDVTKVAALQPLDDSWNWAHAQVSGDDGLATTVATAPGKVISRLLCPRRLDPETAYTAFVVPAFEVGRQAGLGLDVSGVTTAEPAWTDATSAPLRLPVYYRFSFHTSDQGDFESLVRRLTPRSLGASIGQRPMAVDAPMPDVPGAGAPLGLQGALRSLAVQPTPWEDPPRSKFQAVVAGLVNRTSPLVDNPADPDPEVVPPLYGRWPAGVRTVTPGATGWLDELSLDPRSRVAAGMGTQVVQGAQTSLLASAWQQVAGIEAANARLRAAQLARATMTILHGHLQQAASTSVVTLTAPLHATILASPVTVRAAVEASRVPRRLLSPAARRLTHPTGLLRRRQTAMAGVAGRPSAMLGSLVDRVNAGTVALVPAPRPPAGLVAVEDLSAARPSPWAPWFPLTIQATTPIGSFRATVDLDDPRPTGGLRAVTPARVAAVPARPDFVVTMPGTARPAGSGPVASAADSGPDSVEAALFRTALSQMAGGWAASPADPPLAPALRMDGLGTTVLTRLDPVTTVPARVLSSVRVAAHLGWHPADPIREIMAAPSFPQPMYAPLRDLSEQYVLPGADQIPMDTVGLLETNHAFIEAYMVGLSHEMARQLLFVGYPTDCMGTYFRQFWDVSAYVPQPSDPKDPTSLAELLKDIPPIVTWPLGAGLGEHENRSDVVPGNLVLIVRGELFRRYPDAIVYAAKATVSGDHRVIDPSDERYPIFGGTLPGDMTFLGFNLSAADAEGGTADSPYGFFFVFQQHPTGPRFGLEPAADGSVTSWADLAWTNFGGSPHDGNQGEHTVQGPTTRALVGPWTELRLASTTLSSILASRPIPDFLSASLTPNGVTVSGDDAANHWGVDAAQTAYITARLPFRVAIHADLMEPSQ